MHACSVVTPLRSAFNPGLDRRPWACLLPGNPAARCDLPDVRVKTWRRRPIFLPMACEAIEALRAGETVEDERFDALLPPWARELSRHHWTPVAVAKRAAELLAVRHGMRVLDVGAGVGKFCLVGASTTGGIFVGVEQRARLVEVARAIAQRCGVDRCSFVHGNMLDFEWSGFDGLYLFNPFAEQLPASAPIDEAVPRSARRYRRYVRFVEEKLAEARQRTRLVTYHGFGGRVPPGWRAIVREPCGTDWVELWVKEAQPVDRRTLERTVRWEL